MIGIYKDDFLKFLKDRFGDKVKERTKNIVIPCPWCEYNKEKKHYHLYISLEAPIFHCFHADCEQSGMIPKLIKKIEGRDLSEKFIDKEKLKQVEKLDFHVSSIKNPSVYLPPINTYMFPSKEMWLKKRFKFMDITSSSIKGLIFDVSDFLRQNHISDDKVSISMKQYLHRNFVGFLTEHKSMVFFRNIIDGQTISHYKLKLFDLPFVDYYKIPGLSVGSNTVVLSEGIFDIYSDYFFDYSGYKSEATLYACALSSKYESLLKSLVFHEQIFRLNVVILSDNDVSIDYYKKLKKYNSYIINKLVVFYNKVGKDFGSSPVVPTKIIL